VEILITLDIEGALPTDASAIRVLTLASRAVRVALLPIPGLGRSATGRGGLARNGRKRLCDIVA
jgi:hypothetical protein